MKHPFACLEEFELVHAVDGRLRLRARRSWSISHELAATRMARVAGVHRVEANPVTGSLLVFHALTSTEAAMAALLAVGAPAWQAAPPTRTSPPGLRSVPARILPMHPVQSVKAQPPQYDTASAISSQLTWDLFLGIVSLIGVEIPFFVKLFFALLEVVRRLQSASYLRLTGRGGGNLQTQTA